MNVSVIATSPFAALPEGAPPDGEPGFSDRFAAADATVAAGLRDRSSRRPADRIAADRPDRSAPRAQPEERPDRDAGTEAVAAGTAPSRRPDASTSRTPAADQARPELQAPTDARPAAAEPPPEPVDTAAPRSSRDAAPIEPEAAPDPSAAATDATATPDVGAALWLGPWTPLPLPSAPRVRLPPDPADTISSVGPAADRLQATLDTHGVTLTVAALDPAAAEAALAAADPALGAATTRLPLPGSPLAVAPPGADAARAAARAASFALAGLRGADESPNPPATPEAMQRAARAALAAFTAGRRAADPNRTPDASAPSSTGELALPSAAMPLRAGDTLAAAADTPHGAASPATGSPEAAPISATPRAPDAPPEALARPAPSEAGPAAAAAEPAFVPANRPAPAPAPSSRSDRAPLADAEPVSAVPAERAARSGSPDRDQDSAHEGDRGQAPAEAPPLPPLSGFETRGAPADSGTAATVAATPGTPDAAARAETASLHLDAQARHTQGITVRLDDALGHWEVDVLRRDDLLDLVLRGDAGVQRAVTEGLPELRQRLAHDGVTLDRVAFSPPSSAPDATRVNEPSRAAPGGFGDSMNSNQSDRQEARREEAPAWGPPPRRVSGPIPVATRAVVADGRLDRAV